jgi:hypothetical protein
MGMFWPMHWIWNTGVQKEAPTLARSFGCNWRSKAQSGAKGRGQQNMYNQSKHVHTAWANLPESLSMNPLPKSHPSFVIFEQLCC